MPFQFLLGHVDSVQVQGPGRCHSLYHRAPHFPATSGCHTPCHISIQCTLVPTPQVSRFFFLAPLGGEIHQDTSIQGGDNFFPDKPKPGWQEFFLKRGSRRCPTMFHKNPSYKREECMYWGENQEGTQKFSKVPKP